MKNKLKILHDIQRHGGRIILMINLTILAFFFGLMGSSASTYSEKTKLSLDLENATITQVIKSIESQSEFFFIYEKEILNLDKKVTIRKKESSVEEILSEVLRGTGITFEIVDKQIVITKNELPAKFRNSKINTETGLQQTQKVEISGVVKDSKGQPLPGASVVVKGTTTGIVTGTDGRFNLSVAAGSKTLVISFIGMKTQEISITGKTTIEVTLLDEALGIDEVVVVGYGRQAKATVTGAISSIGTRELLQSPQANISNALAGRMPGLLAVQRSGEPGNDQSTIRIRGIGTFTGGQDPLIMVDGIESATYDNIDPNEIENISILKDASATAVYGVRGANGVLLITTKRGKIGKPKVSFTSNLAVSQFIDLPKRMNAYEWTSAMNQGLKYDSYISNSYIPAYSDEDIEKYRTGSDPIFYPDVDWIKTMLKPSNLVQQHNVSINGGTEKVKYFVSVGYYKQGGLYNTEDIKTNFDPQLYFKRYNFRSNFDFQVTKRLSVLVNISSQIENRQGGNNETGRIIEFLERANPIYTPGHLDGKIVDLGITSTVNPFANLLEGGYRKEYRNYLNGSVRFNYQLDFITKGLSAHGTVSYQNLNNQLVTNAQQLVTYKIKRIPDQTIVFLPQKEELPFSFSESINKNRKTYTEFGFDYNKTFGQHNFTGLLLYNQSAYFEPKLAFVVPNKYQGIVGRITYAYKNKYLAEYNVGYNGTENFAPGKNFGFFPAYSLGWVITEESFFPKNNLLSFMKLRATLGEVGNDKIGGERFLFRPNSYSYASNVYYFGEVGSSYNPYKGSNEGKLGNPDLTWERAKKLNLGVDLVLWKDKIRIGVDYFDEHRNNILANKGTTLAIVGANLPAYNMGKMRNSGFDGDITFNGKAGKFDFWVKANYTYAHNIIEFQDEVKRPFTYQYRTGQPYGQPFGFLAEGLYNSWEEVNDINRPVSMYNNNKIQPGDIKYTDINNDGYINDDDRVPIGYSNFPEKVFGLSLGGALKGFDFSVLFQGAANVTYNYTRRQQYGLSENSGAPKAIFYESWTQERYDQGLPINFPHLSVGNINQKHNYDPPSTFWQADASYIRLKNAEIGYTFTRGLLSKVGISSARIYVNGNNLFTWDKMLPGVDPETEQAATNYETYPLTQTFNMGLNINF